MQWPRELATIAPNGRSAERSPQDLPPGRRPGSNVIRANEAGRSSIPGPGSWALRRTSRPIDSPPSSSITATAKAQFPCKSVRTLALEKPQNGLAGLKHWRHDLVAGLVVSLVSLPFSLGIAVASGAPPICGLISAIIAGLVLPFLGGSYVTISGPAAGLAPVLFAAMLLLGRGDLRRSAIRSCWSPSA